MARAPRNRQLSFSLPRIAILPLAATIHPAPARWKLSEPGQTMAAAARGCFGEGIFRMANARTGSCGGGEEEANQCVRRCPDRHPAAQSHNRTAILACARLALRHQRRCRPTPRPVAAARHPSTLELRHCPREAIRFIQPPGISTFFRNFHRTIPSRWEHSGACLGPAPGSTTSRLPL